MSLLLIECSYFHIKNSSITLQNIVYALIYVQQVVIIQHQHSTRANTLAWTERRKFLAQEVLYRSP